jgi:hypothetical protein
VGLVAVVLGACAPGGVADPPRAAPDVELRLVAGDAQEARAANAALPAALVVASVDAATGRPVADVAVAWSTADGALSGEARTDARGEARAEWRPAARLGAQTATARLATGDPVGFRARVVPSEARLARDTLVLRAGERGRAEWVAVDANGAALGTADVVWTAGDTAVASVAADGTVSARGDGVTPLTADLSALGIPRPLRAAVVVGVPLAGRVSTLDDAPAQRLRVYVRTAAGTDSVDVGPDGRFALRARSAALRDETDVLVDAADRTQRRYFPSLWRFTPGAASVPPLDFLLVPRRWRDVDLSLNAALGAGIALPPGGAPWYDRNWFLDRAAPLGAGPTLEAFPDDAFPLPVYFDRDRSKMRITADDSAAFWQALDALGAAVGAPLFRPAEKRLLPERTIVTGAGTITARPHSVAVVVDSVLVEGLASSVWTTACVGASPCAVLDRVDGTLFFSGRTRRVRERALVQHEAGHVLGLGHTCYWTSVMYAQLDQATWTSVAPSCARFWQDGVWPAGFIDRADAVTARDAAYLALYLRAAAAVRRLGPVHGLYAAFLGERRVLLGLD